MTIAELHLLRAIADRFVPTDTDGTEVGGIIALPHLLREIGTGGGASNFLIPLQELIYRINAESSAGEFTTLSSEAQDTLLSRYECDPESGPAFRRLVEMITEGFYTAPEGMALVGFVAVKAVPA